MGPSDAWPLARQTFSEWSEDEIPRLAAALAYYTAFALAPVLLIAIAVASLLFDSARVRAEMLEQMGSLLGEGGARLVATMLDASGRSGGSVAALVVGAATTLLAASGLFGELQAALNRVWEVEPRRGRGILGVLKDRFVSFTMVLGIGFLLLVSLALSAALAAAGKYANGVLPQWSAVLQVLNFVAGLALTTVLFAMIFKVLPDIDLPWRAVWLGAAVTAGLFTLGRFLIGLYLGRSSVGSTYGAAGSLAIVLLWVYYSSQILLLGAEFTQVHARARGTWRPADGAELPAGATGPDPRPKARPRRARGGPDRKAHERGGRRSRHGGA
jgi:membrane protein